MPLAAKGRLINNAKTSDRVYGAFNNYKPLIDRLVSELAPRPVYFFSYDWRLDAKRLASDLADEIEAVAELHQLAEGEPAIDVIAHSMGGLVTAAFMKMYAAKSARFIDQIITCGTPYEGSPVLLERTLSDDTDYGQDRSLTLKSLGFDLLFGYLRQYQNIICTLPSMLLLTPTADYIAHMPLYKSGDAQNTAAVYSLTEYVDMLVTVFGAAGVVRYYSQQAWLKQDEAGQSLGHNYLLSLNNTWYIVGTGERSLQTAVVSETENGVTVRAVRGFTPLHSADGDGTVPLLSATMMGQLPAALAGTGRYLELETDHNGTCMSDPAMEWMIGVLMH